MIVENKNSGPTPPVITPFEDIRNQNFLEKMRQKLIEKNGKPPELNTLTKLKISNPQP